MLCVLDREVLMCVGSADDAYRGWTSTPTSLDYMVLSNCLYNVNFICTSYTK